MQFDDADTKNFNQRSDVLTILCILSFVGGGLAAFSNLVVLITYDEMGVLLEELDFDMEAFQIILSGGKSFFISGFFLYLISLAGVTAMWKLRKVGFHLYAAAQVFLLILPMVSIDGMQFSFMGLLLTAAFIYAYSTQLKLMR